VQIADFGFSAPIFGNSLSSKKADKAHPGRFSAGFGEKSQENGAWSPL
jgi:hypothetical protein